MKRLLVPFLGLAFCTPALANNAELHTANAYMNHQLAITYLQRYEDSGRSDSNQLHSYCFIKMMMHQDIKKLSTYGLLSGLSASDLNFVWRMLERVDLIRVDSHSRVSLTERGVETMKAKILPNVDLERRLVQRIKFSSERAMN